MSKKVMIKRCRALRRDQTPSEFMLWQRVRGRKINGLKFLRQHPIIYDSINGKYLFFIADFYCAEKNLVIELDGSSHNNRKEYDDNRDRIMKELGLTVMRFKNNAVDEALEYINNL